MPNHNTKVFLSAILFIYIITQSYIDLLLLYIFYTPQSITYTLSGLSSFYLLTYNEPYRITYDITEPFPTQQVSGLTMYSYIYCIIVTYLFTHY